MVYFSRFRVTNKVPWFEWICVQNSCEIEQSVIYKIKLITGAATSFTGFLFWFLSVFSLFQGIFRNDQRWTSCGILSDGWQHTNYSRNNYEDVCPF